MSLLIVEPDELKQQQQDYMKFSIDLEPRGSQDQADQLLQRGLNIGGMDHKLGNQLYFNNTELRCFDQITQSSLSKAFIQWICYLIMSLILWIPILMMIVVLHILLFQISYELRFRISYYIYIISFLVYSIYVSTTSLNTLPLLTTALPLILSILFQRALIFRFQIREKLILFQQRRLSFRTTNSCLFRCNEKVISSSGLDQLLLHFATHYRIWGITMHHYVPYGNIIPQSQRSMFRGSVTMKATIQKIKNRFWKTTWNFRQSWSVYNLSERMMMILLTFFSISYAIIPWVMIISHNWSSNKILLTELIISGFTVNAVITYSIITYTEIIFYRLFEYYQYMKHFATMLEITGVVEHRMLDKQHDIFAIQQIEEKENYDTFDIKEDDTKDEQVDYRLYLAEENNGIVWFENWSRIEQLGSLYFNDRKSFVFSVVFCVVFGIGWFIYSVMIDEETMINVTTTTIFIGLTYFMVVFIRLLLASLRFSDLDRKYIALVQNQHTFGVYAEDDFNQQKMLLIQDIVKQIQFRSVSPTIAGVTLNVALVRLAISGLIGLLTTGITTLIRST